MITPPMPILEASLRDAPVVRRGAYHYFVHPLTDGIPAIHPALLAEVGEGLAAVMHSDPERLVTAEAMGIPAGIALAQRTGVPLTVVRKRPYGLPGERAVAATTGYAESKLHINGIEPGTDLVVVDDVVSTGGTLVALLDGLRALDANVLEVLIVLARGDGLQRAQKATDAPVRVLRHIDVDPGTGRVNVRAIEEAADVRP